MKKISGTLGAPELPDVSSKNNYRENFASAFADNQFGRKQTISRRRLQAGKMEELDRTARAKRLAQSGVCMPATAPDRYHRNQESYVPSIFLTARDRHRADQDGASLFRTANQNVIANSDDILEHIPQITCNRDFLDRVLDHTSLHPIT